MNEFLYRFRSIKYLLDEEYKELENQEIYFSTPDKLNDPMEGFKDIFWKGDKIVWKNLLKNYLLCLLNISIIFFINGKNHELKDDDIILSNTIDDLPTIKLKELYQEICVIFFGNDKINKYPEFLSSRKKAIRKHELLYYLKSIHYYALHCIITLFEEYQLTPKQQNCSELQEITYKQLLDLEEFDILNRAEKEYPKTDDFSEQIHFVKKNISTQLDLILLYNNPEIFNSHNKKFILLEFPEKYIIQLNNLIHPRWYTACFSADYKNTSMWGHYSDSHKGVCLKFKTPASINGRPTIKLRTITGVHRNGKESYSELPHSFYEINYSKNNQEIDFFCSLGRLPLPTLIKYWYTDEHKNRSSCADTIFNNENSWRAKYWDDFYECITSKLNGWKHEGEHRLVLSEVVIDRSSENARKLKYSFNDLEGIIFGINISLENKIKIMKIIDEKCKKENRNDFNFYQAYYSKKTKNIEIVKLGLITPSN